MSPPHGPSSVRSGLGWLVAICAVALTVIGVFVAVNGWSLPSRSAPPTGTASAGVPAPSTSTPVDAATALQRKVDADSAQVEAITDTWVPQVSSKYEGLVADGIRYDDAAILADHEAWAARYPGALLLYTGPFSSYQRRDAYATVVPVTFSSKAEAISWCDSANLAGEDCSAKMISRTADWPGATGLR